MSNHHLLCSMVKVIIIYHKIRGQFLKKVAAAGYRHFYKTTKGHKKLHGISYFNFEKWTSGGKIISG